MIFCSSCGAKLSEGAQFCHQCGRAVASARPGSDLGSGHTARPRAGLPKITRIVTGALVLAGGSLTIAAMFPAYFQHGGSLSARGASTWWYNLPAIVVWPIAGSLLLIPRTASAGAGLACGSALVWVGAYSSDIGGLVGGRQHFGPGVILGLVGVAAVVIGGLVASTTYVAVQSGRRLAKPWWLPAVGVAGAIYLAGSFANWTERVVRATTPGVTFGPHGTAEFDTRCCTPFDYHGWDRAGTLWVPIAVLIVALVAAAIRASVGTAGLAGIAIIALAPVLSGFADVARNWRPSDLGYSASDTTRAGLVVTVHPLAGLWVTAASTVSLLLIAVIKAMVTAERRTVLAD